MYYYLLRDAITIINSAKFYVLKKDNFLFLPEYAFNPPLPEFFFIGFWGYNLPIRKNLPIDNFH